jgi:membrane protein YdbS with pleckstrin-like domain
MRVREHGNSFFIVFLEVLLGVVLVGMSRHWVGNSSSNVLVYISVFIVWIVPAVLVWVIATIFEREFRDAKLVSGR